jgi:hypothetical protein
MFSVPTLPPGLSYVRAEAGVYHTVALRSDGRVVAWGYNGLGQCNVPPLPPGTTYVHIAAAQGHTVLLRSDGVAVAFGSNLYGISTIPTPPVGVTYVEVDCHELTTLLLRSDGLVTVLGDNAYLQHNVPPLPPGLQYVDIAAGRTFEAALRSDGQVVMWGGVVGSSALWVSPPPLPWGVSYVEADGGDGITALRRSDGWVVVAGDYAPYVQQWAAPPLDAGTSYVDIGLGYYTVSARVGPTSTYVSFAPGCAGSRPATRLIPRDTPRIGKTHEVTLFDLPTNIALMVMGWQRLPTPIDLGFLGMPGCAMHISLDGAALLAGQNGQAKWFLPIPNQPSLVGRHFFNQALVFDAAAGNPFGAVVSDAAEGVIGHW